MAADQGSSQSPGTLRHDHLNPHRNVPALTTCVCSAAMLGSRQDAWPQEALGSLAALLWLAKTAQTFMWGTGAESMIYLAGEACTGEHEIANAEDPQTGSMPGPYDADSQDTRVAGHGNRSSTADCNTSKAIAGEDDSESVCSPEPQSVGAHGGAAKTKYACCTLM